MKIFKIFFFVALILVSFHPHAFAGQDENASPIHQCGVVCDTCCLSTVPIGIETLVLLTSKLSLSYPLYDFSYQSPSLDTSKRPPAFLA